MKPNANKKNNHFKNKMKITSWRQLSYNNNTFIPVLFFTPNFDIKMYTNQFGYLDVPIMIQGTEIYDGFHYATINEATSLGGCPSDFDSSQVFWSATLPNASFTIYPRQFGTVNLWKVDALPEQEKKKVEPIEHYEAEEPKNPKQNPFFLYIICFFLILIIVIILCFYGTLKK
jgi:preprotein translocase subunit Sec61beta